MSREKFEKIGNLAKNFTFFWDFGSKMRDSKGINCHFGATPKVV
jgi:hypothetical protein